MKAKPSREVVAIVPAQEILNQARAEALALLIQGSIKQFQGGFHLAVKDYCHVVEKRDDVPLLAIDLIHYYATLGQLLQANQLVAALAHHSTYRLIGRALIAHHEKKPEETLQLLNPIQKAPLHLVQRLILLSKIRLLDEEGAARLLSAAVERHSVDWCVQATQLIIPPLIEETIRPSAPLVEAIRQLFRKACLSQHPTVIQSAAEFELSVENPQGAIDMLREAIGATQRPDVSLLIKLAELEYEHVSPQAALTHYLHALRRSPDTPRLHEALAKLYMQLQQPELALKHWKALSEARPTLIEPLIEIATLLENQKDYKEALNYWQQAALLNPHNPRLQMAVVLTRLNLNDYTRALTDAQELTRRFPTLARAHYLEAVVLKQQKNYPAAELSFTQAEILASGSDPEMLDPQFYILRASTLEAMSKKEEALQTLLRAHNKFPDHHVIMNNLAYTWAELDRELDKALALSLKTVEADPDNASYLDTLGWIYYRLGRYDEAVKWLKKAKEKDPQNAIILDHLAEAYARINELPLAIQLWTEAMPLHQNPSVIDQKIKQAQKASPKPTYVTTKAEVTQLSRPSVDVLKENSPE